MVSYKMRVFF